LFDLAYNTMAWRMAPDENGGLRGCPLAAMGIPSEAEYLERYLNSTSRKLKFPVGPEESGR
jgi:aminoglycoside phosphotransferase (APT) family kinase protein